MAGEAWCGQIMLWGKNFYLNSDVSDTVKYFKKALEMGADGIIEEIKKSGFDKYYVDHGDGIFPASASGVPFSAMAIASKGDALASIHEDLAAEQKARTTYDNILRLSDDPDVNNVIKFLREREVVHFQRFGEAVELLRQKLNQKNVYHMNPAFDI